jgi:GTP-binding protein
MASSSFVDYIKIFFRSGNGGSGSAHLYRDKLTAKGGPDGGDGGRGGHIILRGNENVWTLLALRYKKHIFAGHGSAGSGGCKTGAFGKDVYIDVPLGTIGRNAETGEFICEITEHNQEAILVQGGRGGLGNTHFKSPTNQTPRYAQPGESGAEAWYSFELKVLADVGLVGFPNAGKSTLLSVISAAKPKIADYPFTTLVPNLGIVPHRDHTSFVVADIPGIIEGAHEGKGIGLRFLRHIERNAVLLFMIPADAKHIAEEYAILLKELELFNEELLDKPRLLAVTKSDLLDEELQLMIRHELPEDIETIFISSVTGHHIPELKDIIWKLLHD